MATFVLVPGAWHGAWCFEPLARELRRHGHEAYPITLSGVGGRKHLLTSSVNLDTHIDDVVNLLVDEDITDAVLVGHSYGGMVMTGAADRMPERVKGLVYVDAFVPADGDSCWTLANAPVRDWYLRGVGALGYATAPLPFLDPRATPHPLASLLQAIRLRGGLDQVRRRYYVYAERWEAETPFRPTYERLLDDPAWRVRAVASTHDVMRGAPGELLKVALEAAGTD
ncbi:alpha/beta fold hydrolase [Streptomyces sp. NPDC001407]|uniref:alpha/beta fold hydrolase n=1 Tax=unclassified Streptomyces TaxID=2593676 RepID=UPI0033ED95AC